MWSDRSVITMGQVPGTALIVEDDPALLAMLRRHLQRADFVVFDAATEDDAMRRAEATRPDVVILDLALEQGRGDAVCARLRAHQVLAATPVVVLSARDDVSTKVGLLALGADDYVVKPCDPAELIARIRRHVERRRSGPSLRRIGRLSIALESGDAWVGERPLDLTAAERGLLTQLGRNWPTVSTRASLDQARASGNEPAASNVTEVILLRLRRKLAAADSGVEIVNIRRIGYALRVIN